MDRTRSQVDRRDDRALAPVVGVALLLGITVILAAVVGAAVMDVGPDASAPAAVSFAVVGDEVHVTHEGGDPLERDDVVVRSANGTEYELDSDLVTGERALVVDDAGDPLDLNRTDVDRLTVVWRGGDGEQVLGTFRP